MGFYALRPTQQFFRHVGTWVEPIIVQKIALLSHTDPFSDAPA